MLSTIISDIFYIFSYLLTFDYNCLLNRMKNSIKSFPVFLSMSNGKKDSNTKSNANSDRLESSVDAETTKLKFQNFLQTFEINIILLFLLANIQLF